MTHLPRTLVHTGTAFLLAASMVALFGCRTAQQSRRDAAARTPTGGLSREVDSLRLVQEKLVELIDSLTSLASADRERIRALEADVSMLRSRIDGTELPAPPPAQTAEPRETPAPRGFAAPVPPADQGSTMLRDRYESALRLFNDKQYSAALDAMQSLEADDPTGSYYPNYKYWESESLYAMKRYSRALHGFRSVLDGYPQSPKASAAAFKIAECYEQLGDKSNARAAYARLLADYPNSEYHSRASIRLRALTGE
ncbi:MAG: tetratricopeptide repeat protein [Bacteroidota bacterium]|nr:tetratricopeptide repeat protein [Bacteroidota bacterium]MDP4232419.1 tetratricopeptide repeat protein [Bacteroidota bacterium]MDP4241555.1 tetratricopeptide repeat protein [Bacteroidota bacterium]